MQHPPDRPPPERLPNDGSTRTKRSDRLDDPHEPHPGEHRLTEADLDANERERRCE